LFRPACVARAQKIFKRNSAIDLRFPRPRPQQGGNTRSFGQGCWDVSQGDFELPMLIHSTVPPGVDTMKRLRNQIDYSVEIAPKGAQLRITTLYPEALAAIHDFLRFQITDHRTNDSLQIQEYPH
jgi:hypothetical protein